ncbi:TPA: hypothetical protein QDA71_006349 [Burkholderia vietnamiensis]|uniref:hypothetical protein n=1 Tax=Burkholderia vietnamiensis TaxID=60552 RepID=UPI0012DB3950|nr:hypothetical protein [Burkholderia vietnamiensis]MBR8000695.1 hypothetical protein [Burkholderia vietnamiensis]MBR8165728.1 hypothetical protein [Burkholderia vietnamiensis]MCA8150247.1 hypothetical protein [Burkholderia vietnamiensis]QTK85613.1 hypothetical protein J4D21_05935 [Burkholderia vietnamiensis]HDR8949260.1 hypothetical protein [Burkholderia vietnamiensis]
MVRVKLSFAIVRAFWPEFPRVFVNSAPLKSVKKTIWRIYADEPLLPRTEMTRRVNSPQNAAMKDGSPRLRPMGLGKWRRRAARRAPQKRWRSPRLTIVCELVPA